MRPPFVAAPHLAEPSPWGLVALAFEQNSVHKVHLRNQVAFLLCPRTCDLLICICVPSGRLCGKVHLDNIRRRMRK